MSGVNVRNLEKIQDKWLLFQRFVTSIVACRLANGLHILRFKIRNLTSLIFFNVFIIFIIIYFVKKWRSLKEGTSYYHNGDFLIHKIVNAF